jgi:hypothetical protein
MYSKQRILGVTNGSINMLSGAHGQSIVQRAQPRTHNQVNQVTASLGLSGMSGANSLSVNGFWQSNYQYYMTGIIPADPHLIDTSTLSLFYRDIYLFDNTAGSSVDIQSHFPFSDWELRGLEEKELVYFEEALDQLNLRQMMPTISTAHLTDGFFCGSLVFDPRTKQFMDTLIHDALSCAVIPSPFWGIDPTINVRVGQATQQFMHDTSEYARQYLDSMPTAFVNMLKEGAFTLDPVTTMFVPRRSTTDRAYTSYLHRILPMYLIEKTLFRGTLVEAQRRQRAMTHLTAGDDTWTPTGEELQALVSQFQQAEFDPLGGWVSTRNAVQAVDIRPGGDFWKWTDMADVLVPYKLRALGISESFLSGESSYAAAESAYSTFLETMNSYRSDLTDRVFYQKLFPLISVVNNLYIDPKKKAQNGKIVNFLFNKANRANLKMPQLHWHKELEAKGEENMMELLEMASDKGVPIPLKMWMAAAKIDPDALIRDLDEDQIMRKQLEKFTGKDTSHEGEDHYSQEFADDHDNEREIDNGEQPELSHLIERTGQHTSMSANLMSQRNYRRPLLSRDFGDSGDTWTLTKTGKVKHVPSIASADRRSRTHDTIMKIARRVDQDENYRESLRKANIQKLGRSTLPGFGNY